MKPRVFYGAGARAIFESISDGIVWDSLTIQKFHWSRTGTASARLFRYSGLDPEELGKIVQSVWESKKIISIWLDRIDHNKHRDIYELFCLHREVPFTHLYSSECPKYFCFGMSSFEII